MLMLIDVDRHPRPDHDCKIWQLPRHQKFCLCGTTITGALPPLSHCLNKVSCIHRSIAIDSVSADTGTSSQCRVLANVYWNTTVHPDKSILSGLMAGKAVAPSHGS